MLTEEQKTIFKETASLLKGVERRIFMARVVKMLGSGGQRLAERELGWNRGTIRKGLRDLERGKPLPAQRGRRGRRRAEEVLPDLLEDIRAVVDTLNQTDPVFQYTRYYTTVSAAQVREHLICLKGYRDEELPTNETIRTKMRQLKYRVRPPQR